MQILTNIEHFETACEELQKLLFEAQSSTSASNPINLKALTRFRELKKTAEKRIFELVNSKIDDLIETAEYDWFVFQICKLVQDANTSGGLHPVSRMNQARTCRNSRSIYLSTWAQF